MKIFLVLINVLTRLMHIPIFDELNEITCLKKYYNFFEKDASKFVSSELFEKELLEMMKIQQNDPFRKIKITALNNNKKERFRVDWCF